VKFSQLETLVLDEADRMLDMGFKDEIDEILALLPKKRQNLLFSATFSSEIRKLTGALLKSPVKIEVSPRNSAAKSVRQWVYEVDKAKKSALLSHLIRNKGWEQVLVFTRSKKGTDGLVKKLKGDGILAAAIHGDKSQSERKRALAAFKANKVSVLVATDIAARGIDINGLPHVINFDLPKVPEDYIHRIGRTGRAGLEGEGISFVSADEVKILSAIETLIRQVLVREVETGFIPSHSVPLTKLLEARPKKPKKAKKPKQGRAEDSRSAGKPKGARGGRGKARNNNDTVAAKKRSSSKRRSRH
jgi:ATP-dependent RNA helicase RhlE